MPIYFQCPHACPFTRRDDPEMPSELHLCRAFFIGRPCLDVREYIGSRSDMELLSRGRGLGCPRQSRLRHPSSFVYSGRAASWLPGLAEGGRKAPKPRQGFQGEGMASQRSQGQEAPRDRGCGLKAQSSAAVSFLGRQRARKRSSCCDGVTHSEMPRTADRFGSGHRSMALAWARWARRRRRGIRLAS